MYLEEVLDGLKQFWYMLLFNLIVIYFCYKLNALNSLLLSEYLSDDYWGMFSHDNYIIGGYFLMTLLLIAISIAIITYTFKTSAFGKSLVELIIFLVLLSLMGVLIIKLCTLITIPILKVIVIIVGGGIGLLYGWLKSD